MFLKFSVKEATPVYVKKTAIFLANVYLTLHAVRIFSVLLVIPKILTTFASGKPRVCIHYHFAQFCTILNFSVTLDLLEFLVS